MSKDKDEDIVDLKNYKDKKEEEGNKPPECIVKTLEFMLEKAKAGKLTLLALHYYADMDDEMEKGGTLLWNESENDLELLGIAEVIKSIALDNVLFHLEGDEE